MADTAPVLPIQKHQTPGSTNIAEISFDPNTDTLTVEFVDGALYDYMNVPRSVYLDFCAAGSAGQFFARQVKGRYSYEAQ